MKKNTLVLLLFVSFSLFAQKEKQVYKPIPNTSLEESFPHAAAILESAFKVGLSEFDYGGRVLKSDWFEYHGGILSRYRCKFLFFIDDSNTLNVEVVDVGCWDSNKSQWTSGAGLFSKKEDRFRAALAESIRLTMEVPEYVEENKTWFFNNLSVTALFFEKATDLAGNRWFEAYLKDKEVSWEMVFSDIERNPDSNKSNKYKETFVRSLSPKISSSIPQGQFFYVVKYTDSDANVLAQRGSRMTLKGYCRALTYVDGIFSVILTDKLDTNIPVELNSVQKSDTEQKSVLDFAEKLKNLKELLDLGIITNEEYEVEKKKILSSQ